MKTALICGANGQDGAYLARLLLEKDYAVWGTSRDAQARPAANLKRLGIDKQVRMVSMSPIDFRQVYVTLLDVKPDEVYYLAGQSSVGLSFDQPSETIQSITIGSVNILEACRMATWPIRLYHAGSSECFGDTGGIPADETTPFKPRSPYAVAKAAAFWLAKSYRQAYDLFACTGILFNHESPLRPLRFVTQKIIHAANRIAKGSCERLQIGDLSVSRDWGWAPEYVEAMWLMLQQDEPCDFVVATGQSHQLQSFLAKAFSCFDLDWHDHVDHDEALLRPNELRQSLASPLRAEVDLGWKATVFLDGVVDRMAKAATASVEEPELTWDKPLP
jgi:GDPmannose 4,6-dehydratase